MSERVSVCTHCRPPLLIFASFCLNWRSLHFFFFLIFFLTGIQTSCQVSFQMAAPLPLLCFFFLPTTVDSSHCRVIFSFSLTTAADVKDAKSTISVSLSATTPAPLLEVICRCCCRRCGCCCLVVVVVV